MAYGSSQLSPFHETWANPRYRIVSLILIVAAALKFLDIAYTFVEGIILSGKEYSTYFYSEFLINFEGGVVRRGLLGQLLYAFSVWTGMQPGGVIFLTCCLAYLAVFLVILSKLKEKGLNWWILLSTAMCGYMYDFIRKDYLLLCLFIFSLALVVKWAAKGNALRMLFPAALLWLGLMQHEAFIFYGVPVLALYTYSATRGARRVWSVILFAAVPVALFCLASIFHGDKNVAESIILSWNQMFPGMLEDSPDHAVGAIGWNTLDTVAFHVHTNFIAKDGLIRSIYYQPLIMCVAYYFVINILFVFRHGQAKRDAEGRLALSCVYLLTAVTMLPMFLLLSCDYGRLYQYIAVVSVSTYLFIPAAGILRMFPARMKRAVSRLNAWIDGAVPPSRRLIVFLLLFVGPMPYSFKLSFILWQSPVGTILYYFDELVVKAAHLLVA